MGVAAPSLTAERRASPLRAVPEPPAGPLNLDALAARWQRALAAAEHSLVAAAHELAPAELAQRRHELARERAETRELLARAAKVAGAEPPWLAPVAPTPRLLGLPRETEACLFDLEGVLTDGARLQAWAWQVVFDDLLQRLAEQVGWRFAPFDRDADYRAYLDGRTRLDGVYAFLESRGISLPVGSPLGPLDADTAHGLAQRKGDVLARRLHPRGVNALEGARRYLEAAGQAGLPRAVISASSTTLPMLELAGLATLVDQRVDADVMVAEALRPRPSPDLLLVACRRLGVEPGRAVTLTHRAAGVVAGRAAGLHVIGVGEGADAELLAGAGAEVVPSLATLLYPVLR
jgi:HAD superfamily hydrolase (TIGR01509 family)